MSDDDPLVSRIIRMPNATISIHGTLSHVDQVYRDCTSALLASGKYTIPAPGDNPWQEYGAPKEDNVDHLRRRVRDLEAILSVSENHAALQAMRASFKKVEAERDLFKQSFSDLDHNMQLALYSLQDDPEPNLYNAVAIEFLSSL